MSVTINTTRLNNIIRNVDGDIGDVIATIAFAVEREAKINAPVDTGALYGSIYTKRKNGGHQPEQRDGVVYVDIPEPENDLACHVGPTTDYALIVELGSARRAATPYLLPAVETMSSRLDSFHGDMGRALSGR